MFTRKNIIVLVMTMLVGIFIGVNFNRINVASAQSAKWIDPNLAKHTIQPRANKTLTHIRVRREDRTSHLHLTTSESTLSTHDNYRRLIREHRSNVLEEELRKRGHKT